MSTPWPENPKFCKDCKWYKSIMMAMFDCTNPRCAIVDLVHNDNKDPSCYSQRLADGACGIEGRYFEPKEQKL